MDFKPVIKNFKNKLKDSKWDTVLTGFLDSQGEKLLKNLYQKKQESGITPDFPDIFRAFRECPYNELKVVIIGQDPYPKEGVADGISFSCSRNVKPQPSLKFMLRDIQENVHNGKEYLWDLDLKRWSNQGVLMLNTALTTTPGKVGQHYDIWNDFTSYLLNYLSIYNPGLIYVFMGGKAKAWDKLVSDTNTKLYCKHPASAVYSGQVWDSGDIFNRVNEELQSLNNLKINW